MKSSSDIAGKKGGTPLLTGINKIHISPDMGRLSIPSDTIFSKQVDISATIIEKSAKDVFSLGLAVFDTFAATLPDPGKLQDMEILTKIAALDKIGKEGLQEDLDITPLLVPWVFRAIKLPEKNLFSVTLQKPYIKALKVLSIRLEMEAKQIIALSAQSVQAFLATIDYLNMTQEQILIATQMQVDELRKSVV